jgi:hypothetical protein
MRGQIEQFLRRLTGVVGRCVAEDPDALEAAVLILVGIAVAFCICCFGVVIHDFILDPDSTNVATRLTQMSIDPDKWKFLS